MRPINAKSSASKVLRIVVNDYGLYVVSSNAQKHMRFGIESKQEMVAYYNRPCSKFWYNDYNRWLLRMMDLSLRSEHVYGFLTAEVRKTKWLFYKYSEHILILDCDSDIDLILSTQSLKSRGIKFITVMSSPGRYWVICDRIGAFCDIFPELVCTPGVDKAFVEFAERNTQIQMRLFYLPGGKSKPHFDLSDLDNFDNHDIKKWVLEFNDLYDSSGLKQIYNNRLISKHTKANTLAELPDDIFRE